MMSKGLHQGVTGEAKSLSRLSLRNAYLSFAILIIWAGLFWPTTLATINIWLRSETYAHGFVVLPIVIWLLWRDKSQFLTLKLQSSLVGALLCLMFILLWLMGQTLEITVFRQLGLFGGIAASHWMVFGNEFARRYQFPLCYLIFAVPMGNSLIPLLQHLTAEITVFMLHLSDIPVFYEGLYITLPSGRFEVAEACSGIRYLIASTAVGTLYAYLSYRSLFKQGIFVAMSVIVPILANGIRAYLIVMIAHLSDLKYATGVDHLIYGWLFFGFIILLMFFVGGFFADNEQVKHLEITSPSAAKYNLVPLLIVATFAFTSLMVNRNIELVTPPDSPQPMVMPQLAQFSSATQSLWGPRFNDSLAIFSGVSEQQVELFIAQFANRQTRGELVTSTNWYYDKKYWSQTAQTRGELTTSQGDIEYVELQLVSSQGRNRLVRYWYAVNDNLIADLAKVKLSQALLALQNSRQPVFFIALSTSFEGGEIGLNRARNILTQSVLDYPLSLTKEL